MKHLAIIAALAVSLTGCATTTNKDVSPAFTYSDSDGRKHYVTGEIIKTSSSNLLYREWSHALSVKIDGTPALSGPLDPSNFSGTVTGANSVANCTSIQRSPEWFDVTCEVAVNGNPVGKLTF